MRFHLHVDSVHGVPRYSSAKAPQLSGSLAEKQNPPLTNRQRNEKIMSPR